MTDDSGEINSSVSKVIEFIAFLQTNKVAIQKRWGIYVKQAKDVPLVRVIVCGRFCVVVGGAASPEVARRVAKAKNV